MYDLINEKAQSEEPKAPIVQLTQWNKHYQYPSLGTMRNIAARRKENGAEEFLLMIHNRFYVDVEKFHLWLSKQAVGGKNNDA